MSETHLEAAYCRCRSRAELCDSTDNGSGMARATDNTAAGVQLQGLVLLFVIHLSYINTGLPPAPFPPQTQEQQLLKAA